MKDEKKESMTYAGVGVDYDAMDPFKRMAQIAGRETAGNIRRLNGGEFQEVEMSRGESAYLIEAAKSYFAHVEEGASCSVVLADWIGFHVTFVAPRCTSRRPSARPQASAPAHAKAGASK